MCAYWPVSTDARVGEHGKPLLTSTWYFYYDTLRRPAAVRDATDGLVYYGYDGLGNRLLATDQRANTSYFHYDDASRLSVDLDPVLDLIELLVRRGQAHNRSIAVSR